MAGTARMFLPQHAFLHSGNVGNVSSIVDRTLADLTQEPLRLRPGKGLNSIAWLLSCASAARGWSTRACSKWRRRSGSERHGRRLRDTLRAQGATI